MFISVIVASYNYENFIKNTLESILSQTYTNFEVIVVDDCSMDNSVELINEFAKKDNRIKLFVNEENIGLKNTILKGIENAKGEWIAFLESDDIWQPDCLEKRVEVLNKNSDIGLIFNHVEVFGDEDRIKQMNYQIEKTHKFLVGKVFPRSMLYDMGGTNKILTFSAVMIKKEYLKSEYFNTPVDKLLDWWLYIHIAKDCDFYYIPEKLTRWRLHRNSYISKNTGVTLPMDFLAYFDVFKNYNRSIKFTIFFIYEIFALTIYKLFFDREQRIRNIRRIKKILHLPLRDNSPF